MFKKRTQNISTALNTRIVINQMVALLLVAITSVVFTVSFTMSSASAATFSQGFHSNDRLPVGAIVSLKNSTSTEVVKTNIDNQDRLIGVVTDAKDTVIELRPAGSDIKVATEGRVNLLVTDVGGEIKKGDLLSVSPLAGIAMKGNKSGDAPAGRIIATAQQDLDKYATSTKQIEVSEKDGGSERVSVGLITADLSIDQRQVGATTSQQNILERIGSQLTGKSVGPARILASGAVFASSMAITGVLLQSSVRGTFISLGRNPLSRNILFPVLARVMALSVFVLASGAIVAYIILTI